MRYNARHRLNLTGDILLLVNSLTFTTGNLLFRSCGGRRNSGGCICSVLGLQQCLRSSINLVQHIEYLLSLIEPLLLQNLELFLQEIEVARQVITYGTIGNEHLTPVLVSGTNLDNMVRMDVMYRLKGGHISFTGHIEKNEGVVRRVLDELLEDKSLSIRLELDGDLIGDVELEAPV
jgi:hypothetical protein